jgi:hypothetical protein
MTIGDYRQLSDALFHAGTDSGSEYEYVDAANRLHFYVLDLRRGAGGVLSYTIAVRSLDGAGPHRRGVAVLPTAAVAARDGWARCTLPLRNTGRAAAVPPGHPDDVTAQAGGDVYRISAAAGAGWSAWLPATVTTARFGQTVAVPVYAKRGTGAPRLARVRVTATSESDPTKTSTGTCVVVG